MAIDHPLMQYLTDLSDPIVDIDFGASSAQRRPTTHGDAMGALSTVQTAILDIAHLVGIAAREHLAHKPIVVAGIVARIDVFEPLPVLDKDLLEDVPVLRGRCKHQGAPSWGRGIFAMQLLYHVSPTQSTPSSAFTEAHSPPLSPLNHGDFRPIAKCKFLYDQVMLDMVKLTPILKEITKDIRVGGHDRSRSHDRKLHETVALSHREWERG
jgi:hypothetical protein